MLNTHCLSFCSGTRTSYLTDLLALRLVGAVEARIFMSSSFSQWALSMKNTQTQALSILSQAL